MESLYEYGSRAGVWRVLRPVRRPRAAAHRLRASPAPCRPTRRWSTRDRRRRPRDRRPRAALDQLPGRRRRHRARPPRRGGAHPHRAHRRAARSAGTPAATRPNTRAARRRARRLPLRLRLLRRRPARTGSTVDGTPHLVVPYTLDTNDMRFATPQGFNTGDQFFTYCRDAFDVLYAEGRDERRRCCRSACTPASSAGRPASPRCERLRRPHHRATTTCGCAGASTSPATGSSTFPRRRPTGLDRERRDALDALLEPFDPPARLLMGPGPDQRRPAGAAGDGRAADRPVRPGHDRGHEPGDGAVPRGVPHRRTRPPSSSTAPRAPASRRCWCR